MDFVRELLNDTSNIDPAVLRPLQIQEESREWVEREMRRLGADDLALCVSEKFRTGPEELSLYDGLLEVMHCSLNSMVFAVNSRVAYYENHEGERYLLVRS